MLATWHHSNRRAISSGPLFTYRKTSYTANSREVSKPQNSIVQCLHRSTIWQAFRQLCCRGACQISDRFEKPKPESRGFENSGDLAVRRPSAKWIETLAGIHSRTPHTVTPMYITYSLLTAQSPQLCILYNCGSILANNVLCQTKVRVLIRYLTLLEYH